MTREQAIKSALKFLVRKQQEQGSWGYADNDDTHEVSWDEIIEWLEQEPCEDCISRQAAIDALMELLDRPNHAEFLYTDEICRALNHLLSVEPERKTGKWIEGKKTPGYIKWNCSECGLLVRNSQKPWYEYCPKCGVKMEVDR